MSIIDTLIIDRTQADAELARRLGATGWAAMTDEQRALYLSDQLKGAYKASDLNRVNAAMDYLVSRLKAQGINVPIKRSKIPHKQSGGKRLPEGHNELKWIESTGTQYVDTELKVTGGYTIEATVEFTSISSMSSIWGTRNAASATASDANVFSVLSALTPRCDYFGNTHTFSAITTGVKLTIQNSAGVASINGESYVFTPSSMQSSNNLWLFGLNSAGILASPANLKYYSGSIRDDSGILIRDYVPDMLDSGEVGLYDLVEGKFYPNAGTGVFLAGPRRVELPEGFTQVEWIGSTGEQYADTGFVPNQDTRIVVDIVFPNTTYGWLLGQRSSGSKNSFGFLAASGSVYRFDYNTSASNISQNNEGRWILDLNKNVAKFNGQTVLTHTYATFQAEYAMYLFSMNNAGAEYNSAIATIYSCRIYGNDTLSRDYIPCITANGAAGLYDLVTNEFYGNAGSGAFTYGDIVEWEPLPDVEVLDDYTWYDSDVPTSALLVEHLANVSSVRSALRAALPEIPADMDDGLTIAEANNIELVLVNMEQLINNMLAAYRHCGVTVCGMGGLFL